MGVGVPSAMFLASEVPWYCLIHVLLLQVGGRERLPLGRSELALCKNTLGLESS